MSTPRDSLKLLSAILTGLMLGFFVVHFFPGIFPSQDQPATLTETGAAHRQPENKHRAAGSPAVKQASLIPQAQEAQPPAPAPREDKVPSKENPPAAEASAPAKEAAPRPARKKDPRPSLLLQASASRPASPLPAKEMTAALQPLLSFKIDDSDAKRVKEALEAAAKDDDSGARAAIKKISSPVAKNFAEWRRLRRPEADLQEGMAFRLAHPLYPGLPHNGDSEKTLFLSDAPAEAVLRFYGDRLPVSGAGYACLGGALLETGRRARGLAMIRFVWARYILNPAVEKKFRARFGPLLTGTDHRRRELLLAARAALKKDPGKNTKAHGRRSRRTPKAKGRRHRHVPHRKRHRHRKRHSEVQESKPEVREAAASGKVQTFGVTSLTELVRYKKHGRKAVTGKRKHKETKGEKAQTRQAKAAAKALKLSKQVQGGPATLLARLKGLRREKADEDVWSLLRSLNPDTADLADPGRWWDFRKTEVRRALNQDHPRTAYAIAKTHGPLEGEDLSDAEFMAGWIALRFMHDPLLAIRHFDASRVERLSRTETRAAYWLGRAKKEVGATGEAARYFTEAASRFYTFYGALARQALGRANTCRLRAPTAPSARTIAAFVNEDAFKGVMIAKQLDMEGLLNGYVLDLARQIRDPEQMTLVLELARRVTKPNVAVRAAKIALLRGFSSEEYAFPDLLPEFKETGGNDKLEQALLNALTRQESEFHTGTVSPAGARGLMQLMPQTAKEVAATVNMKYRRKSLVSDPSYNVTLGSVFLAQLLSRFDGSYILTLAAYNAGPGRVAQWIKENGDPREKGVDPVDWVERIPFTETRQYVQRILESIQLYRCGYEDGKSRFRLVEDLHRGRRGRIPGSEYAAGSGTGRAQ
jgi:soluble lytic murein transglycosylase